MNSEHSNAAHEGGAVPLHHYHAVILLLTLVVSTCMRKTEGCCLSAIWNEAETAVVAFPQTIISPASDIRFSLVGK